MKVDIVDINMGCLVNKVVKNEVGVKWLCDFEKIYYIVKEVMFVFDILLIVKMCIGWFDLFNVVENVFVVEFVGVFVFVMYGWMCE